MGLSATGYFDTLAIGWIALLGVLLVIRVLIGLFRARRRRLAITEFAEEHHMDYLGSAVPKSLGITNLPNWKPTDEIENMIRGPFRGVNIVVFDHYSRNGRRSSKKAIVGLEMGKKAPARSSSLPSDGRFSSESAGLIAAKDLEEEIVNVTGCLGEDKAC